MIKQCYGPNILRPCRYLQVLGISRDLIFTNCQFSSLTMEPELTAGIIVAVLGGLVIVLGIIYVYIRYLKQGSGGSGQNGERAGHGVQQNTISGVVGDISLKERYRFGKMLFPSKRAPLETFTPA